MSLSIPRALAFRPEPSGLALVPPLALALGLAFAPAGGRAQAAEPCADAEDFGSLSLPFEVDGSLEDDARSARVDFFRFETEPGLALVADMTDQRTEPNTMRNPLLGLFDADCDRLAYNDFAEPGVSSLDARLTFPVPEGGVFFLAAAASPDIDFDGSSDDTGAYTLRIDLAPPLTPLPAVVEAPSAAFGRAADGRVEVILDSVRDVAGYNVHRDGRYATTVRPPPLASRFFLDGIAGDYCLVAFVESGDLTRYSRCGDSVSVGANGFVAGPPSGPRELRAAIYSPGVVALAWLPATDDGRVVAYRIRRDGVELERTDRRSLVERGLEPGRTYRYAVTAIDDDGLEGAPVYLDVRPATNGAVPPTGEAGVSPSPPGAIRGVLYSPGVAEIFWNRSPDHARLAGYEVRRDGQRVAFHRGASHFESPLPARASHTWSVVAVGADGARSVPRRLRLADDTFTPRDETPSNALITRENHAGLIAHAFDLYVGDLYNPPLFALRNPQGLELVSRDTSGNPILDVYDCGDGRAELALLYSGTNFGEVYDWTFERCRSGDVVLDGTLNLHEHYRGPSFRSPGLAVRDAAAFGTTFAGAAHWWPIQSRGGDQVHSWETESLALQTRTVDGALSIEDATSRFAYGFWPDGRFDASLEGSFAVRSDRTGGTLLNASTPTAFAYARAPEEEDVGDAWSFTSGQLELVAEDGSRVTLDADSGDAATVRITIDDERGSDSFVAPWTQWRDRLRFDRHALR